MEANLPPGLPPSSAEPTSTEPPEPSDKILIEGCRVGDAFAWEQIVSKYQRLVMSVPLSFGFDSAESEDIAQITFTILMQSLDNLRSVDHLGSWLYTVSQRHTWRALKRNQRTAPETLDENISEARVVFGREGITDLDRRDLTEWINQGLNKLGPRCQALLTALYFDPDEPDYVTIAQRLNVPVGSIGPTRARCLKTLQQILQRIE
jgi:RNA polymerase sigma factor (sigma-70 family)